MATIKLAHLNKKLNFIVFLTIIYQKKIIYDKIIVMNTLTLSLSTAEIEKLSRQLSNYKIKNTHPSAYFTAKIDGHSVIIYHSRKLVIQGKAADQVANHLGLLTASDIPPDKGQQLPLIGTDEVGNGSYFGGVAVVASFVTPEQHSFLKELGVGDSKTLTDQKIRQMAPVLKKAIPHKALLLSPKKYNDVVGDHKPYNAVSVKVALHNQAIYLLLSEGNTPERIVIDAFTSSKNYQNYVQKEKNQVNFPIDLIQKAEHQFLAVAVSSIIARAMFLDNLDYLSQEIGYKLPSGAGVNSDIIASQILKTKGMASLETVAKLHFANTKKALKRLD